MMTEFENNAIEVMLTAGISEEHIQRQKKAFIKAAELEDYYDPVADNEGPSKEIPVQKISGIKGKEKLAGKSVYDLFMGVTGECDTEKIKEHLHSLQKNGLAFQQAFYSGDFNLEPVHQLQFNYYQEDDCYILQEQGLHRLVAAKMFDAPYLSGVVTVYELNEANKKLYAEYISLKELLRLTDMKGMTLDLFREKNNF